MALRCSITRDTSVFEIQTVRPRSIWKNWKSNSATLPKNWAQIRMAPRFTSNTRGSEVDTSKASVDRTTRTRLTRFNSLRLDLSTRVFRLYEMENACTRCLLVGTFANRKRENDSPEEKKMIIDQRIIKFLNNTNQIERSRITRPLRARPND